MAVAADYGGVGVGYVRIQVDQVHDEPAFGGDPRSQGIQRPVREDAALADDHHAGTQGLDVVHVVCCKNDGDAALSVEAPDEVAKRQLGDGVQAYGGLVQEQDGGDVEQRRGQVAPHSLAEAELSHRDV